MIVLPDVESSAIRYLKDTPEIAAIVGESVASKLPHKAVFPYLVVSNIGGVPVIDWRLGADVLQVDAWGRSRSEARTLALTAHAALVAWRGSQTDGTVITGTQTFAGVQSFPDPNHARWLFRQRVWSHP